jgi:hypothetical protein
MARLYLIPFFESPVAIATAKQSIASTIAIMMISLMPILLTEFIPTQQIEVPSLRRNLYRRTLLADGGGAWVDKEEFSQIVSRR